MEIEFNTGRIPQAESSKLAARRDAAAAAPDSVSFSASNTLKSQLGQTPLARPEQVAKAKQLVADSSYPPDYLLVRIANLLAVNMTASSSDHSS